LPTGTAVIAIHAVVATLAIALGGCNLVRTVRGDSVHKAGFMIGSYCGLLGAFIGVISVPVDECLAGSVPTRSP
jgi:uncharacterized membrane protein